MKNVFSFVFSQCLKPHRIFIQTDRRNVKLISLCYVIGSPDEFSMVFLGFSRQTLGHCLKKDHDYPLSGPFQFTPIDHHLLLQKTMLDKQLVSTK
jgi:hypothetical protein